LKKILILKPSSLGDVVQALPVLRLIKNRFPGAQSSIHWWLDSRLAPLLENDPDLDSVVLFQRKRWSSPMRWPEAVRSILELRKERFDWVIDLQGLARSGTVAWLANGSLTIGVEDRREKAFGFYDIAVPRPSPQTHAVDWYLEVARALEIPITTNFEWLAVRKEVQRELEERWRLSGSRWVIVVPGARWMNKRWPVAYFADAVRGLMKEDPDLRFAVVGSGSDTALAAAIAEVDSGRVLDLTGKTTLPELIEWIRASSAVITNDTGPMHIAAALGKPVVAVFGPTDPARTGPYGGRDQVLRSTIPCAPCHRDWCRNAYALECLHRISPSMVVSKTREILAR
jgi:heptosyltransferase-1